MKAKLLPIFKQLFIVIAVVVVIGQWQSRHLPSGDAPLSQVRNLVGERYSLPEKRQATLFYFFAPWCGVCRLSMANLNSIQDWFPKFSVKAVALDFESEDEIKKFASDVGLRVPIYLGDESVRTLWNVNAYPTYVVVDANGTVRAASVGYSSQFGMILRVIWTKLFA